jgi:hypothetical protein
MRNFAGADEGNRHSSRHDIRKAVRLEIPGGLSIFARVNSFGLSCCDHVDENERRSVLSLPLGGAKAAFGPPSLKRTPMLRIGYAEGQSG